jgi:ADP-ribose diphosphatase
VTDPTQLLADDKPRILNIHTAARSRLFEIEAVQLQFSNGNQAEYERVSSRRIHGAVIVVPMLTSTTFLLIREYAVGFDRYELGLPKGLVRAGETFFEAANRELMEEVGFRATELSRLYTLSVAPGFLCYSTEVVIAMDLTAARVGGDEPEAMQIVPWRLRDLDGLLSSGELTDARSVAALFLAKGFVEREAT